MSKSVECYRVVMGKSVLPGVLMGMSVECYRELLWASVDCRVKAFW